MTARYVNAFKAHISIHSPEPAVYETDARPEPYRGVFMIYQRQRECFDLVLDGVCIAQRAGRRGATSMADLILDEPGDWWAARALRLFADAQRGVDR